MRRQRRRRRRRRGAGSARRTEDGESSVGRDRARMPEGPGDHPDNPTHRPVTGAHPASSSGRWQQAQAPAETQVRRNLSRRHKDTEIRTSLSPCLCVSVREIPGPGVSSDGRNDDQGPKFQLLPVASFILFPTQTRAWFVTADSHCFSCAHFMVVNSISPL